MSGMGTQRPVLIFDTSAINTLADDHASIALIGGINAGYFVRVPETVIAELVAVLNHKRRRRLFDVERRLRSEGEIIRPFAEIIRTSIKLFEANPGDFDWRTTPVSFRD